MLLFWIFEVLCCCFILYKMNLELLLCIDVVFSNSGFFCSYRSYAFQEYSCVNLLCILVVCFIYVLCTLVWFIWYYLSVLKCSL